MLRQSGAYPRAFGEFVAAQFQDALLSVRESKGQSVVAQVIETKDRKQYYVAHKYIQSHSSWKK